MRVLRTLLLALCLPPALAHAQTAAPSSGPEVLGTVTVSNLWDDEGRLGAGIAAGGGVGYRWRNGLGVEVRVERFSNSRTFLGGTKFDATGTRVLGQVAYYWSTGSVQPFAAGTFGVLKIEQRNEYPIQQPGPAGPPIVIGSEVFEDRDTDQIWGGGGGVRFRVNDRFALRPEAGLLFSTPHNFIDIRVGVTASISW
jgi:hypothetical protein